MPEPAARRAVPGSNQVPRRSQGCSRRIRLSSPRAVSTSFSQSIRSGVSCGVWVTVSISSDIYSAVKVVHLAGSAVVVLAVQGNDLVCRRAVVPGRQLGQQHQDHRAGGIVRSARSIFVGADVGGQNDLVLALGVCSGDHV